MNTIGMLAPGDLSDSDLARLHLELGAAGPWRRDAWDRWHAWLDQLRATARPDLTARAARIGAYIGATFAAPAPVPTGPFSPPRPAVGLPSAAAPVATPPTRRRAGDAGYEAVRRQQAVLVACAAVLGLLSLGISVYFLNQWRLTGRLGQVGVRAEATVDHVAAEQATVTFPTPDGNRTTTIDRLGPTLCPNPPVLDRLATCGTIPEGLTVAVVYDPANPSHAEVAQAVTPGYWRNCFVGAVLLGALLLVAARRRGRALRALRSLNGSTAPVQRMRITAVRGRAWTTAAGSPYVPCRARVEVSPLDGGAGLVVTLFPALGVGALAPGLEVDVVGDARPGRPVLLARGAVRFWPAGKARAGRRP